MGEVTREAIEMACGAHGEGLNACSRGSVSKQSNTSVRANETQVKRPPCFNSLARCCRMRRQSWSAYVLRLRVEGSGIQGERVGASVLLPFFSTSRGTRSQNARQAKARPGDSRPIATA